jgi:hypothetical protein
MCVNILNDSSAGRARMGVRPQPCCALALGRGCQHLQYAVGAKPSTRPGITLVADAFKNLVSAPTPHPASPPTEPQ